MSYWDAIFKTDAFFKLSKMKGWVKSGFGTEGKKEIENLNKKLK